MSYKSLTSLNKKKFSDKPKTVKGGCTKNKSCDKYFDDDVCGYAPVCCQPCKIKCQPSQFYFKPGKVCPGKFEAPKIIPGKFEPWQFEPPCCQFEPGFCKVKPGKYYYQPIKCPKCPPCPPCVPCQSFCGPCDFGFGFDNFGYGGKPKKTYQKTGACTKSCNKGCNKGN